ncbi:MAG: hypothetical protein AAF539_07095 [Planctomycetota bacterium]
MKLSLLLRYALVVTGTILGGNGITNAQETPSPATESSSSDASAEGRESRFAAYLTGATFTGNFTSDNRANEPPKPESYVIDSCRYIASNDKYELKVQIKYGKTDGTFPILLDVLWAGSTPVITLDNVWIPGLGTFSSRVIVRNGRYAGTWQHDAKGGHLYGQITPKS